MKSIIYVTRQLDESIVAPLRTNHEVIQCDIHNITGTPIEEALQYGDRVVALWTALSDQVTSEVMDALPNLKVVANMAVGYNNIDIAAANERGITVTNTPGVLSDTTADLAFGLLMSTARMLPQAEKSLRAGEWSTWEPFGYAGMDIHGASIGIIGMGRIGEALARRAYGFDMDISYHNRTRKEEAEKKYDLTYRSLEDLLKTCQFIAIFAPLTEETNGLIGREELALLRPDAIIINAARGEIIDEDALYDVLKEGKIFGAGLDVYSQEPIDPNHKLLTLPNVVALPHIGSASIATRTKMAEMNVEAILAVLNGETPENIVQ